MSLSASVSGRNSLAQVARGARAQIAAAEARCGARQRADRVDDQPLAAEPGDQQHQQAEEAELQIGELDLAVDAGEHLRFVEPDEQTCIARGDAHEAEHPTDPVEAVAPHGAFVAVADFPHHVGVAHC